MSEHPDPDTYRGLYGKFEIRRTDGRSAPGEKHAGCNYFVLDLTHDRHAVPAIDAYADSCVLTFPRLARDLRTWARERRFQWENAQHGNEQTAPPTAAAAAVTDGDRVGVPCANVKDFLRHIMQRLGKRQVAGVLCTVTLQTNSVVSVNKDAAGPSGSQPDLFTSSRGRAPHHRRERGQHIRVR